MTNFKLLSANAFAIDSRQGWGYIQTAVTIFRILFFFSCCCSAAPTLSPSFIPFQPEVTSDLFAVVGPNACGENLSWASLHDWYFKRIASVLLLNAQFENCTKRYVGASRDTDGRSDGVLSPVLVFLGPDDSGGPLFDCPEHWSVCRLHPCGARRHDDIVYECPVEVQHLCICDSSNVCCH